MRTFNPNHWIAFALAAACSVSHAADAFAPPGAKATLSVDYVYESAGKKRSEGMYDPYEWRAKRSMNMVADLVAQPATAMPTVQAIDAAQMAQLQGQSDKAQAIAGQMAPMAAEAQKAIAKCGNDEACMTREAMKMAAAMQGTPQMAAAMNAKKDAQELGKPGAMRYQAWRPTAQRGTYNIDESVHISVTDPICTSKPRHRCTRDEVRKGSGEIPVPAEAKTKQNKGATAGLSAVEVDAAQEQHHGGTANAAVPAALYRDHHHRRTRRHARHPNPQGPASRSSSCFGSAPPAAAFKASRSRCRSRAGGAANRVSR